MESKTKIKLDAIMDDGCLSVTTVTTVDFNGAETEIGRHIDGLTPSDLERAKEILPDNLYNVVQAMWTPEVVAAWEKKRAELAQSGDPNA